MNLIKSAATVGSLTMVSRILGFIRDILIAAILGASPIADAFFVAFKLPNFFRRLFAEGAFNAGFVPIFSELLTRQGMPAAHRFAEQALSLLLLLLLVFVTLLQIFMPLVMLAMAPGFVDHPETFDLAVLFTRITFPYLLFISLVSLFGGILNSVGRFAAMAATPILLNLCLISAATLLAPFTATPGHALSIGVVVAGMVQMIWLLVACQRAGWPMRLRWPVLSDNMKRLLRRILPAALGAGVVQVNLLIDLLLASLLPVGSISYLFYADRLNQLPLGVVGVAVGTAILPLLSKQLAKDDTKAALNSMNRAIEITLLLAVPAMVAFMILPEALITTLFQRGHFSPADAQAAAGALLAYAVGLPAYVLVKVLSPGYFARGDTRTPFQITAIAMAVNLVLNLILMQFLAHIGLALATAISAWFSVFLLWSGLRRRGHWQGDRRLARSLVGTLAASAAMGVGLWILQYFIADFFTGPEAARIAGLIVLVVTGLLVYGVAVQLFGAMDWRQLPAQLRRGGGSDAAADS